MDRFPSAAADEPKSDRRLAMVFPGQGSQSVGMQAGLAEAFDTVRAVYAEASDVLGFDLWTIVSEGPAERLAETTVTQPAMLAAGVAAWRAWQEAGGESPEQMAGHSLGEYTALVCAGAFEFADAMRVVKRRSELMQDAVPAGAGAMAAIIGLDDDQVLAVCTAASADGVVDAVNFNAPGQVVIAGNADAVKRAVESAKEEGARRAIVLPVSVPAHSSLMREAGETLADTLAQAPVASPRVTVVCAAAGEPYRDADDIRARLSEQVYSPVLWVQTVQTMIDRGATKFIECGPGKVLSGLVRRIDKSVTAAYIDDVESLENALAKSTT